MITLRTVVKLSFKANKFLIYFLKQAKKEVLYKQYIHDF